MSVPPDPAYRLALGDTLPSVREGCCQDAPPADGIPRRAMINSAPRADPRALLRPVARRASRPLRPRAPCRLPRPPRVPRATRRVARCVRRRGRRVRGVLRRGRPGRSRAFLPGVSVHDHPARADHAPPPGDGDPLEAGRSAAAGRARVWVRVDSRAASISQFPLAAMGTASGAVLVSECTDHSGSPTSAARARGGWWPPCRTRTRGIGRRRTSGGWANARCSGCTTRAPSPRWRWMREEAASAAARSWRPAAGTGTCACGASRATPWTTWTCR